MGDRGDRKSIRFHLKKGIKFESGNPVTAQDVAWSLKRLLVRNLAQSSFLKTRGFKLEAADKLFVVENDQTFVPQSSNPDDPNLLLMILAQNGPGSIIDSKTAMSHEKMATWAARG